MTDEEIRRDALASWRRWQWQSAAQLTAAWTLFGAVAWWSQPFDWFDWLVMTAVAAQSLRFAWRWLR